MSGDNTTANCTCVGGDGEGICNELQTVNLEVQLLVIPIFVISLVGNVATIAIISLFKERKVPDVLVLGLAITDLLATIIPVPMSIFSYVTMMDFCQGSSACDMYGTIAMFTRNSSVLITTVIAVERYLAICKPFFYKRHCTPLRFAIVLIISWATAFVIALIPAVHPDIIIKTHHGFCLFDFASRYSIAVIVYGTSLFIVMLVCFILVTIALVKHRCRQKGLRSTSSIKGSTPSLKRRMDGSMKRSPSPKDGKRPVPKLVSQISDVGRTLKRAASARFQYGVEIQFLWMFSAVVALFYISWLPIVGMLVYAQIQQGQDSLLETISFWAIRFTVVSLAINPFLYGLLAGQYRQVYVFLIKLLLSKCCPCIKKPEQNIHARQLRISRISSLKRHQITFRHSNMVKRAVRISTHFRNSIFGQGLSTAPGDDAHSHASSSPERQCSSTDSGVHSGVDTVSCVNPIEAGHSTMQVTHIELDGAAVV